MLFNGSTFPDQRCSVWACMHHSAVTHKTRRLKWRLHDCLVCKTGYNRMVCVTFMNRKMAPQRLQCSACLVALQLAQGYCIECEHAECSVATDIMFPMSYVLPKAVDVDACVWTSPEPSQLLLPYSNCFAVVSRQAYIATALSSNKRLHTQGSLCVAALQPQAMPQNHASLQA